MADQKTIAVVIPAGQNGTDTVLEEVTVVPGSTAQSVLNLVGKGSGYILGTMSGDIFGSWDLIFSHVQEGASSR